MSLRKKVLVILFMVTALSGVLSYVAQRRVFLPSFAELEREEAMRNMSRCVDALKREIHHLDVFCGDWAAWDDTWRFVADKNRDYVETNLVMSTFLDNRINLIYFINESGEVVWGACRDLETQEIQDVAEFQKKRWPVTHSLLQHKDANDSVAGIAMTSLGPMLLSSRAIVRSDMSGPMRGSLLMGRLLNEDMVDMLAAQTNTTFGMSWWREGFISDENKRIVDSIRGQDGAYLVRPGDKGDIEVFALFPCILGKPCLLLHIHVPPDISERGKAAMSFALWSTLVVALTMLLILMGFLRRAVIDPLHRLTSYVTSISKSSELSLLPGAEGEDELGVLTREFNEMVRRIRRDAAERSRAEDALRESEERYRSFVKEFQGIAFRYGADMRPVFLHGAVEAITGFTEEDFLEDRVRWENLVHPDDAAAFGELRRLIRTDPDCHDQREYRIVDRAGCVRWVHQATRTKVDKYANLAYTQGAVHDITELKHMADEVTRTKHLAMIGEMSASVAHEIRNPLTGISSAVQVIGKSLDDGDERKEVFEEVVELVGRVEQTVQALLMFAKPWTPEKRACDVAVMLKGVCREAQALNEFEGVALDVDVSPGITVHADEELLSQVVMNLLRNALQAMPGGGEIRIGAGIREGAVVIMVADTGHGVPDEIKERVFQPFFTTKTRGTGLGLAVCRQIVEAHGGSICVRSGEQGGAEFTVEIPLGELA